MAQCPPWQVAKPQQSMSFAHAVPTAWQVQRPIVHVIVPQQSESFTQGDMPSWQHTVCEAPGSGWRQSRPWQQSVPAVHVTTALPGRRHMSIT